MVFARVGGALGPVRHALRKNDDKLGPVDFDFATNSQGMEVKSFTVRTLRRDGYHAIVLGKLTPENWVRKSDRENEIGYSLVWEGGRWARLTNPDPIKTNCRWLEQTKPDSNSFNGSETMSYEYRDASAAACLFLGRLQRRRCRDVLLSAHS
jgi:hypothetical protein